MKAPELSLTIPCYNEEASIGETAPALVRAFAEAGVALELVLVDNGSTDNTSDVIDELIANGLPATKVSIATNTGYSPGIIRGLEACTAPIIGFVHADGQVASNDVVMVYRLMERREQRVLAKVRRRFRGDSWRRKIVSIIYNGLMQVMFGWLGAIDINGSPKMFSRETFQKMQLQSTDWFLDPEIILKAKWLGIRVIEIDVEGRPRSGGASHVRRQTMFEFLGNICRYRFGSTMRQWFREVQQTPPPAEVPEIAAVPAAVADAEPQAVAKRSPTMPPGFEGVRVVDQKRFEDTRGFLHKILTATQTEGRFPAGEVYCTAAHPGEAKGNHYHERMGEWFAVVQGNGALLLCDPKTGARHRIDLLASQPVAAYVPPGIAHAVVNVGDGMMMCIACAEAEHDPSDVVAFGVSDSEPNKSS
ncbi:MAG: dTDP-4-dehydrorhamnose 3,5-epimerase-like enzyme [Planctomycetota bacterium]|jgi:dTDP-4-dehydrorhamnose 3,5-epimerase-like enzyme